MRQSEALSPPTRSTRRGASFWAFPRWVIAFARAKPLGFAGAVVIFCVLLVAISANMIAPHDPYFQDARQQYAAPSWEHPLGGDEFGRDILSRLMFGARYAVIISISSVLVGTCSGAMIGIVSAYFGGWADTLTQRATDTLMSLPSLIIAMAIVSAFGPSVPTIIFAIGIIAVPGGVRLTRSLVLSLKATEFIVAAKALGCSTSRILRLHVLPQVMPLIIVAGTAFLGSAILIEATLGFLGFGVPPPTPTWGSMASGKVIQNIDRSAWLAVFPGLTITLAVLGVNLLGDAVRDMLDPRLRR